VPAEHHTQGKVVTRTFQRTLNHPLYVADELRDSLTYLALNLAVGHARSRACRFGVSAEKDPALVHDMASVL
jgi:hypothetical protein